MPKLTLISNKDIWLKILLYNSSYSTSLQKLEVGIRYGRYKGTKNKFHVLFWCTFSYLSRLGPVWRRGDTGKRRAVCCSWDGQWAGRTPRQNGYLWNGCLLQERLRIRITIMRIRIQLFTSMRIRSRPFTLMRIRILISDENLWPLVYRPCRAPFWSSRPPLWASTALPSTALFSASKASDFLTVMRIRI